MSSIQSFLNATGLSYLWGKITNKFVDKESLTTVVNAIDDVKLDKAELVNISDLIINLNYTSSPSTGLIDQTFIAIKTALNNKQTVYLQLIESSSNSKSIIPLTRVSEDSCAFYRIFPSGLVKNITISSDNSFTYNEYQGLETPEGVVEYVNKRIVYSETAPANPIEGTVWLIP